MSHVKKTSFLPPDVLGADGYLMHDSSRLSSDQRQCTSRFAMKIQLKHEEYLANHTEVSAILKSFFNKQLHGRNEKNVLKNMANFFHRPVEELYTDIGQTNDRLHAMSNKPQFHYKDENLLTDLRDIIQKHYSKDHWNLSSPSIRTPDTLSSSFISIKSSATTVSTPESVPTPEPTLSDIMFGMISNTVDKAIFANVDEYTLNYDTAYVELSKAVEEAMEVPVITIREDIAKILFDAYILFEHIIKEKAKIAAQIAWENRMRKKLKKTLRRTNNFIGYENPSTPNSEVSSHESQKLPPLRPCKCHPQWHYNRHPKDRFGIYLPRGEKFSDNNVIMTPTISITNIESVDNFKKVETNN